MGVCMIFLLPEGVGAGISKLVRLQSFRPVPRTQPWWVAAGISTTYRPFQSFRLGYIGVDGHCHLEIICMAASTVTNNRKWIMVGGALGAGLRNSDS
jgi:hypothetical protein